jgi:hypothetical protein
MLVDSQGQLLEIVSLEEPSIFPLRPPGTILADVSGEIFYLKFLLSICNVFF